MFSGHESFLRKINIFVENPCTMDFLVTIIIYIKYVINSPVPPLCLKFYDHQLLLGCNIPSSNIWTEVVQPPESATLSSTFKTCKSMMMNHSVAHQSLIKEEEGENRRRKQQERVLKDVTWNENKRYICLPAAFAKEFQTPSPWLAIQLIKIKSSSMVHGPFLTSGS